MTPRTIGLALSVCLAAIIIWAFQRPESPKVSPSATGESVETVPELHEWDSAQPPEFTDLDLDRVAEESSDDDPTDDEDADSGRLAGVVVDASGNPVPGATVYWRRWTMDHPVTTDSAGRFAADGIDSGSVELYATSRSCPSSESVTTEVGDFDPEFVTLVLQEGGVHRVRIVDMRGDPIEDAVLILRQPGCAGQRVIKSDAQGECELVLRPDLLAKINIVLDPYYPFSESFPWRELPNEIALEADASVRVVILEDAIDRIDRLEVLMRSPDNTQQMVFGPGDAVDGVFHFRRVKPDAYSVRVIGGPFPPLIVEVELADSEVREIVYPGPSTETPVTVEVRGPDGEPVPGAHVYAQVERGRANGSRGTTDGNGRIALYGLRGPNTDLRVVTGAFAEHRVRDVASRIAGSVLRIDLVDVSTLTVKVRDAAGSPVVGAVVKAWSHQWGNVTVSFNEPRTDADGLCVLGRLRAGRHQLQVQSGDGRTVTRRLDVGVAVDEQITVTLPASSTVSGGVTCRGRPVEPGGLEFKAGRASTSLMVGDDGLFSGGISRGTYRVTYRQAAYARSARTSHANRLVVDLGRVNVEPDAPLEFDYDGYDVTVVLAEALPKRRYTPYLRLDAIGDRPHFCTAPVHSDGGSELSFPNLPAGRYRVSLHAGAATMAVEPREFEVGADQKIELKLVPSTPVSFAGSLPSEAKAEMLDASGRTASLGVVSRNPVVIDWPAGDSGNGVITMVGYAPFFFSVAKNGAVAPAAIRLTPSATIEVDVVDLLPGAELSFRLTPLFGAGGARSYWAHQQFQPPWSVVDVHTGQYRITLYNGETELDTRDATVAEGDRLRVEF